jgi:DNA ligase-1
VQSSVVVPPATDSTLTVGEVDRAIEELAALGGSGSVAARRAALERLFGSATAPEQDLLRHVLGGELRQGALDGVLTAAIASAANVPVDAVQRAAMFAGDLGVAARVALTTGADGLAQVSLRPGRPVQPMLASTAPDLRQAVADGGPLAVDWKIDGIRVQIHRAGGVVSVFTRNLNEVTERLPSVVDAVAAIRGGDVVLDGEAIGLLGDDVPQPFQDTMSAAGSSGPSVDVRPYVFDVLFADGSSTVDLPLVERRALLAEIVPAPLRLPSIVTADPDEAEAFLASAIAAGHEGVMVKALGHPYTAGRRGAGWRKVKPVHTLDLVVLAVEWGHGRRRGWLSNIHLGARDDRGGDRGDDCGDDGDAGDGPPSFVMVGKTFKGMTDEMLAWQTERFLELEIARDGHIVHVRPEQVVEVAVDGVQRSTRYAGGVALRFARVRRYRDDKRPAETDTVGMVARLLPGSLQSRR